MEVRTRQIAALTAGTDGEVSVLQLPRRACSMRVVVCWDVWRNGAMERLEVGIPLSEREGVLRLGRIRAAVLSAGKELREVELKSSGGHCINDPATGLMHIDVPEAIQLSLRPGGLVNGSGVREAEILFARTSALARLGALGGRYEVAGGRILSAE